ncbi:MAG TPA: hypothetical protein VG650_14605 [Mycobacteriales bacterium]|nr:hypothetical protein [Mycobacteriales bacterium]
MGGFFGAVFGIWVGGAMLSSFYFWAKRTDRSQAPVVRRFTALAYGFAWPYFAFQFFASRQQTAGTKASLADAEQRILGGGPIAAAPPHTSAVQPQPTIQNPFDNL